MLMSGDPYLFSELVTAFEADRLRYCILASYDRYPERIASDVDFMVVPADAPRAAQVLARVAARSNARLVQCVQHETTAAWFVIARQEAATISFIQPDLSTDYRRRGRLWLQAEDIVARRRWHAGGFWVASAADAFIYYLIKRLDKGALSSAQAEELERRYREDPQAARQLLRRHFPAHAAGLIEKALLAQEYACLDEFLVPLRDALHSRAPAESMSQRLFQWLSEHGRVIDRLLRPTGLSIAFLGPDGCGKSSVIDRLQHELRDVFRRVDYQHLRPRPAARTGHSSRAPVLDPHAQLPRGTSGSIAKLIHFWASYVIGALLWTFPRRVSSTLVIFDRYYHDIVADPRRYRYGAPLIWARLLGRLVPQPELIFVLDASPEVVQARKQEVSFPESVRQREAYLDLARQLHGAHVIDASQPLDRVVAEVVKIVLTRLESRLAAQLGPVEGA
jgi:thymidylate kinase